MGLMTTQPITPPPGRIGFFEITYRPGKAGVPGSGIAVFCIEASGFVAAKKGFDSLEIGEFRYIKEITEEQYREWEDLFLDQRARQTDG